MKSSIVEHECSNRRGWDCSGLDVAGSIVLLTSSFGTVLKSDGGDDEVGDFGKHY